MDKCFDHLEKQTNTITGFIVLQSLLLADKLSEKEFIPNLKKLPLIWNYVFWGHLLIVCSGIVALFMLLHKIKPRVGAELATIRPRTATFVKAILTGIFGFLPIIVMLLMWDRNG